MTEAPQILLQHHLKQLRLPTFQGEYAKQAQLCAAENKDHIHYLARLCEMELIDRERRMIERRVVITWIATRTSSLWDRRARAKHISLWGLVWRRAKEA